MGPIGCPETSVRNCHYCLRNDTEERSSQVAFYSKKLTETHRRTLCARQCWNIEPGDGCSTFCALRGERKQFKWPIWVSLPLFRALLRIRNHGRLLRAVRPLVPAELAAGTEVSITHYCVSQVFVGDSMKTPVITISVLQGHYVGEGIELLDQACGCVSYARYSQHV